MVQARDALYHGRTHRRPNVGALLHSRTLTPQFMTILQALVLGLLQGLSEFLPISSSAHLTLAPWLFGWKDPGLAVDVALHLGTLIALVWFFWQEWMTLLRALLAIVRKRRIEMESE